MFFICANVRLFNGKANICRTEFCRATCLFCDFMDMPHVYPSSCYKKCPDEITSAGHPNKLGRVYPFLLSLNQVMMNEMMDGSVRLIKLNAFSSKAMISVLHGRSSDLFPLPTPSRKRMVSSGMG